MIEGRKLKRGNSQRIEVTFTLDAARRIRDQIETAQDPTPTAKQLLDALNAGLNDDY